MLGVVTSPYLHMYSDASKAGLGATFGKNWIQAEFPPQWRTKLTSSELHISFLELFPLYVMTCMFGSKIANTNIIFHSDNSGVVAVVNKQSSRDQLLMSLIRPLVLKLIEFNINLKCKHIQGLKNVLCDRISRFQVTPELLHSYGMHTQPTPIPHHLHPISFVLPGLGT